MRPKKIYLLIPLLAIFILASVGYVSNKGQNTSSELVKIVLRDTGHKLLLLSKDSTSLVLAIEEIKRNKYQLSFENKLSIVPDSLVNMIRNSFKASMIFENYIVEVLQCDSEDVAYSYQITKNIENNIIPCLGRNLPVDCYTIQVLFLEDSSTRLISAKNVSLFSMIIIAFLSIGLFYKSSNKVPVKIEAELSYTLIGKTKYFKDQNKLIFNDSIIKLTSKECELIDVFSKHQNQIVKREFLIQEVWENNGVYVDRSLDTFISKIRKKFKEDNTVSIINVHGVGYKLQTLKIG